MVDQTKPKLIFFGTPLFSKLCLEALVADSRYTVSLVVTNPDRPAGRGKKLSPSPVKEFALRAEIPCITVEKISKSSAEFISEISTYGPFDVGVVVAFGQLMPVEVLHLPSHGSINVHGSLLPRWRGAAPMQRAIMEGDAITGVQLMQMEAGLDTGAVYATATYPLNDTVTLHKLHDRLAELGSKLLCDNLLDIVNGALEAVPQSSEGITYAKKISNEEARINWSMPAEKILRHIHGISAFPGAFSFFEKQRIKIFRVALREPLAEVPLSLAQSALTGGTVTYAYGDELRVKTGCGKELALLDLQIEGKKRMQTKEFLSGVQITAGQKFE